MLCCAGLGWIASGISRRSGWDISGVDCAVCHYSSRNRIVAGWANTALPAWRGPALRCVCCSLPDARMVNDIQNKIIPITIGLHAVRAHGCDRS